MKRILALAAVVVLALAMSAAAFADNGEKKATPSRTKFVMDGKDITFDVAYNIEESNYIQLRSVAQTLNGTKSQFNVYYDNELGQAVIETGKAYTGVKPSATETATPTPTAIPTPTAKPSYKVGDTVTLPNATIRVTSVNTADSTPPDEYGSKLLASSGHKLLCVSFDVTANSLNHNNTLWYPNNFVSYATAASGINYEMPFSQGTTGFGADVKKSVTVYIEVPSDEMIVSVIVSDGQNNVATVTVK
jgi:outer membrane lipoprotein-sorting protein